MKQTKKLLSVLLVVLILNVLPLTTVPTNAASESTEMVEFNGHRYQVFEEGMAWSDARYYCESLGGHLVTITSEEEQVFIESIVIQNSIRGLWLGGYRKDSDFIWLSNETMNYQNWLKGEPNNYLGRNENVMILLNDTMKWYDFLEYGDPSGVGIDEISFICEWEGISCVSGTLTGWSTAEKLAIDHVWYKYDTSNERLVSVMNDWVIGDYIYCKLEAGVIVACSNADIDNCLISSVSVSDGNSIEYTEATKKYDRDELGLSINVVSRLKSKTSKFVSSTNTVGFESSFDKIVVSLPDTDTLYFENGLFGWGKSTSYEIEINPAITLSAGQVCYYSNSKVGLYGASVNRTDKKLTLKVNTSLKWGDTETQKHVPICVEIYNGATLVSSGQTDVVFNNPVAEERIKEEAKVNEKVQQAANIINNTSGVLFNDFLSEVFTSDQLKCIETAIQCKIALAALPESVYQKEGFSDKVVNKLISYAGVSRDWLGNVYNADINLEVEVDSSKYGLLKINFYVPVTFTSIGSGNPYGGWSFSSNYSVVGGKGKKNVPSDKLSGDITSMFTYANMKTFSDSVQSVAMAQLEKAYNLGYGNDFNKACEMVFGDTITEILSHTKFKNYSHLSWEIMTFPATHVGVYCPVDVFVYNAENKLCASIEDNAVTQDCEDIEISINGDEKHLTFYKGEFAVKLVATAEDYMRVTVDEYANKDTLLRSVSTDNLVLTPGDVFEAEIKNNHLDNDYLIEKNQESSIYPASDSVKIHAPQIIEVTDTPATCLGSGEMHTKCSVCGDILESSAIPALGHIDEGNDGKCDRCGEKMTGGNHCKYCGKIHNGGFFDKLTGFFHRILAIFKR